MKIEELLLENGEEMSKAEGLENVKCPDCRGEMISRKGKYGIFWGCKNFPVCKGTRDSMGRSKADREAERLDKRDELGSYGRDFKVGPDNEPIKEHTKTSWNKK